MSLVVEMTWPVQNSTSSWQLTRLYMCCVSCPLQVAGDRYDNMEKTSYHYSKAKAAAGVAGVAGVAAVDCRH